MIKALCLVVLLIPDLLALRRLEIDGESTSTKKMSIYLLGDSVTEKLYSDGLVPSLHCEEEDPRATRWTEVVEDYHNDNRGFICTDDQVTRVGYMFHWGINRDGQYHIGWKKHRSPGDSENSVDNIKSAILEFQNRTAETDEDVYFIFLSRYCISRTVPYISRTVPHISHTIPYISPLISPILSLISPILSLISPILSLISPILPKSVGRASLLLPTKLSAVVHTVVGRL